MGVVIGGFKTMSKRDKKMVMAFIMLTAFFAALMIMNFAFATGVEGATEIKTVLGSVLDIVCMIFQVVGVVLGIYAVGQLIMAFKNDDADSKSRASTMLVVGVCLVVFPTLAQSLGLVKSIGAKKGDWTK